mmetsp:Transcript_25104/g.71507  ORF Transcript_25104/g.71507 Transcript_25104/m.71507 type:complete len:613 (+) Transcript_25104:1437-3275(+)
MRRGQRCSDAVVVHHRPGDGAYQGLVLVAHDLPIDDGVQAFDAGSGHTITARVPIGGRVEGQAAAPAGEPAGGALRGPPEGRQQEVRCDGDAQVVGRCPAFLLAGLRGQIESGSTRGGLRVQGHGGPLQSQDEGEAAGADTQRASCGPEGSEVHLLVSHTPLRVATADVHAARRPRERSLAHAHVGQGAVADLQDQALVRVHRLGLVWRQVEELAVEHLDALHEGGVVAVRLVLPPALGLVVEDLTVVPSRNRDVHHVVRRSCRSHPEDLGVLTDGRPEGSSPDSDHLALVVHVVHGLLPIPRNLWVPHGVFSVALLQLPQPIEGPFVQHRGRRGHGVGHPLVDVRRQEEAGQDEGPARGEVLVAHEVGPEHDHGPGRRGDLVQLCVLCLIRLQLQRARGRSQKDQHHEAVPHKLRQPLHDLLLSERNFILVGLARLVDHAQGAVRDVDADELEVLFETEVHFRNAVVQRRERLAVAPHLALQVRALELGDAGRALLAQEPLLHGLVDPVPSSRDLELLQFDERLRDGTFLEDRPQHAEALDLQVARDFSGRNLRREALHIDIDLRTIAPRSSRGHGGGSRALVATNSVSLRLPSDRNRQPTWRWHGDAPKG